MPPDERDGQEPEEEFVKVDRRASREAGKGEEAQAGPEAETDQQEGRPEPTGAAGKPEEERPELNVYSLLRMSVGMYVEQAWIHLGLRADPTTNKTETNLPLAKVAIDTVTFIVEELQPDLDASEKRELETLLANLRINYVRRA
jgi:hypothetical protein